MRLLSDIVESIRQVCRYEKTVRVDTKALQSVMMIFVLVMLLIDIENFKLGKYIIGGVTLAVAVMSIVLVIVLKYIKNVYRICQAAVVVFFILAVIISIEGTNDGFSLLWFLLLPVITLVLLGMPFGAPVCIFFGLYITVLFWTHLNNMLIYNYTRDYLFYYPIFYWGFCLLVVAMDIFYKLYQIRQADNEKNLEAEVLEAVEGTKKLMIDAVTAISQMLDEKDVYTQEHSKRAAEYSKLIAKNLKAHEFTDEEISLIYRSAFLHDIGKIREISSDIGFPYTMEGRLLGHVSMSAVMVQEAAGKAKVTGPKLQQLLHIVLSHHGEQEKGSPVACATKESFIVHYADEIDAIMNQFSKNEGKNPWEYNKMLQRFLLHEA